MALVDEPDRSEASDLARAVLAAAPGRILASQAREQTRASLFGGVARPTRVGRYVIGKKLAAGGMGVVYRAHDPDLDRDVAIKVLHVPTEEAGQRLLREARMLAGLTHPNVVQPYDVGVAGRQVFLAMELVDGVSLRDWIVCARSWRDVTTAMLDAGRGLAAVHDAGFVHRDFKPENVVVGADGAARVIDFGLARFDTVSSSPDALVTPRMSTTRSASAGAGTAPYMAPERLDGGPGSVRSDIFAFCVTFFEALHGARPFIGSTPLSLLLAMRDGPITAPGRRRVPRGLQRAIARGLAFVAEDRPASMHELLAAVQRGVAPRRGIALVGAGALGVVALGAVTASGEAGGGCEEVANGLHAVWNPRTRATLEATHGGDWSRSIAGRVADKLDVYADAWMDRRRAACEDRDTLPEVATRRRACLGRAANRFEALVAALSDAPPQSARALEAVVSLPPLPRCFDEEMVAALHVPPEAIASSVAAVRRDVDRAAARRDLGDAVGAHPLASAAVRRAESLGYAPLVADAVGLQAAILDELGRTEEAITAYQQAYFAARRSEYRELSFVSASHLATLFGTHRHDLEQARSWLRHAEVELSAQDLGVHNEIDYLSVEGTLAWLAGDYDGALAANDRACTLAAADPASSPQVTARLLQSRAVALVGVGRIEDALEATRASIAAYEGELGREHPVLLPGLLNLVLDAVALGEHEEALAAARQAMVITERLGPDNAALVDAYQNMAVAQDAAGDASGAEQSLAAALRVAQKALGREHPHLARIHSNLGVMAERRGDLTEAVAQHERAVAIAVATRGEAHPDVAQFRTFAASALRIAGELARAEQMLSSALESYAAVVPDDHPDLVWPLRGMGEVLLADDRAGAAIEPLERAAAITEASGLAPEELAKSRSLLADALWAADRDRGRAVELKRQALPGFDDEAELERARRTLQVWEGRVSRRGDPSPTHRGG